MRRRVSAHPLARALQRQAQLGPARASTNRFVVCVSPRKLPAIFLPYYFIFKPPPTPDSGLVTTTITVRLSRLDDFQRCRPLPPPLFCPFLSCPFSHCSPFIRTLQLRFPFRFVVTPFPHPSSLVVVVRFVVRPHRRDVIARTAILLAYRSQGDPVRLFCYSSLPFPLSPHSSSFSMYSHTF